MHPRRPVGLAGVTWIVPISATRWPPDVPPVTVAAALRRLPGPSGLLGIDAAVAAHGVDVSLTPSHGSFAQVTLQPQRVFSACRCRVRSSLVSLGRAAVDTVWRTQVPKVES